jgi:hypothetical protein
MARFGLATLLVLLAAAPVSAQVKPPILARAEACLRSKVDRVVAIEPDADSAANFLLDYACAGEVSDAARYELNLVMVKQFAAMGSSFPQVTPGAKAQPVAAPSATVDPETGDIVVPPPTGDAKPDFLTPMLKQMGSSMTQFAQIKAPVSLRKLAGELVLEARERQGAKAR